MANTKKIPTGIMVMGAPTYTNGPLVAGASSLPANTKQKEILKKILRGLIVRRKHRVPWLTLAASNKRQA